MGSQNGYEDERHLSKSFDDMQLSEFLGSRAVPGPIINLEGKPIPEQFTGGDEQEYIVDRGHWKRWVPEWIRLNKTYINNSKIDVKIAKMVFKFPI